jgi:hypothetical protein
MKENFKKTVNLKDRMAEMEEKKRPALRKKEIKASEIDKLYEEEENSLSQKKRENTEFKKMNKPPKEGTNSNPYKGLVFILIVFVLFLAYYSFFRDTGTSNQEMVSMEEKWYSVELVNGEVFYGLVSDVSGDPFVVRNVYYNYDQEKEGEDAGNGNLRLVKRGKETYGPDGDINIIRSQVHIIVTIIPNRAKKAIILVQFFFHIIYII